MRWWFAARRAGTVLPAGLAAYVLLLVLLRENTAALPSLFSSGAPVVLVLAAPVPLCAAVLLCLESRSYAAEVSGVRPVRLLDALLVLAVLACAVLAGALAGAVLDSPSVTAAGRNTVFLAGLMLCLRPLAGHRAALVPACWVLLVVFAGFDRYGHPHVWTVVPRPPSDPYAAVAGALAAVAALTLLLRSPQREPRTGA
jgi:hypothetical protein